MGSPTLYYYPSPQSPLVEIDLVDVSEVEYHQERNRADSPKLDGGWYTTDFGQRHRVRIVRARFAGLTTAGEDLRAQLETLESHLKAGGAVGFAEDSDKAWAGYLRGSAKSGATTIRTRGNAFYGGGTLAADDYVVIQSPNPEGQVEHARLATFTKDGRRITLNAGIANTFLTLPTLIRHRGFWPMLRLPEDRATEPIVTTDRRMNYTLQLELVEDTGTLHAVESGSVTGDAWRTTTSTVGSGKIDHTQLMAPTIDPKISGTAVKPAGSVRRY